MTITAEELYAAFFNQETGIVNPMGYVDDECSYGAATVDGEVNFTALAKWINGRMALDEIADAGQEWDSNSV